MHRMVYVENPLCTVPDDKGNGTSAGRLGRERRCQGKAYLIVQPARKIRFQAA